MKSYSINTVVLNRPIDSGNKHRVDYITTSRNVGLVKVLYSILSSFPYWQAHRLRGGGGGGGGTPLSNLVPITIKKKLVQALVPLAKIIDIIIYAKIIEFYLHD